MKITAVIIDDEYLSIEELSFLLSKIHFIEIVGKAECGLDGLDLIRNLKPDLAFVDVKMPDISGIQLVKKINELDIHCKIIFTTAYDKYAIEAFNVDAIDYILKPYEEKRVIKSLLKAREIIENTAKQHTELPPVNISFNKLSALKDDRLILIDTKDILLIYTEDRNIFIKTKKEIFSSSYSMQELEERLSKDGFFRTHRSYLVNLNKIKEVSPWFNGSYIAVLDGINDEIPISRNHVKEFKRILGI